MIEKRLSRAILDTNTLISAAIFPKSVPGEAVAKALRKGLVLRSEATWLELQDVIGRKKFDRYQPGDLRREYVDAIFVSTEPIEVTISVHVCRHPKDDKFLELALAGNADFLITGDADLLALHPFHKTAILTAAEYLAR